ncbi:hypothetical protein EDB80DRAFT_56925 [Ilyonectria destructans]|nr:hypothetical protein EDB80DRAFT_56925 [Ilyonectria destructans]
MDDGRRPKEGPGTHSHAVHGMCLHVLCAARPKLSFRPPRGPWIQIPELCISESSVRGRLSSDATPRRPPPHAPRTQKAPKNPSSPCDWAAGTYLRRLAVRTLTPGRRACLCFGRVVEGTGCGVHAPRPRPEDTEQAHQPSQRANQLRKESEGHSREPRRRVCGISYVDGYGPATRPLAESLVSVSAPSLPHRSEIINPPASSPSFISPLPSPSIILPFPPSFGPLSPPSVNLLSPLRSLYPVVGRLSPTTTPTRSPNPSEPRPTV